MDYLEKYNVKGFRKFQEGGAMPAGPEGAPAGGGGVDPMVQESAQLLMQLAEAAMGGDPQAGEVAVQIAQAIAGGGEGGAPAPEQGMARNGAAVYRQGGSIGGPVMPSRATLIPRK